LVWAIARVAVAQPKSAIPPAASARATPQRAIVVDELVVGIGFPMGRFAATSHYHTGPPPPSASTRFYGRRQVHQGGNRAKYALRVMYQPNELPQACLAPQINHSLQSRMMMAVIANLNKLDAPTKVVHHCLVTLRRPPFNRDVILPPGSHNPERDVRASHFPNLRVPDPLLPRKVDVSLECGWLDCQTQALV
jgi:hypothetical protein